LGQKGFRDIEGNTIWQLQLLWPGHLTKKSGSHECLTDHVRDSLGSKINQKPFTAQSQSMTLDQLKHSIICWSWPTCE